MRLADNEVGPGLACLLVGALGFVCWSLVLLFAT
jgi:nitrate reductase NapE component